MTVAKKPEADDRQKVGDWMLTLRAALFDAVSENDMRDIAKALVRKAKDGDMQAVRMLFSYVIGAPNVNVENAVIVAGGRSPDSLPLDRNDRVAAMAERARLGLELADKPRKLA